MSTVFRCKECSFKASFPSQLRRHSRTHSSEKPFQCPNLGCDYMSRWPSSISMHQRSCRGQIQILCGETSDGISIVTVDEKGRSEDATDIFSLGSVKFSGGNRLYSCGMCGFTTRQNQFLTNHPKSHSDLSPTFHCPIQGFNYLAKWPQVVRRHSRRVQHVKLRPKKPRQTEANVGPVTECGTEAQANVNNSSRSRMAFACTLFNFVGDSELSALEHARQHKTVQIPVDATR